MRYLDGDDERQRPKDQRQHSQYIRPRNFHSVQTMEAFAQGVQRARANVAEDDAQSAQGQELPAAIVAAIRNAGVRFNDR